MMKCLCVCVSRKIITSHFRAERQRGEVSSPFGLAGRRPALASLFWWWWWYLADVRGWWWWEWCLAKIWNWGPNWAVPPCDPLLPLTVSLPDPIRENNMKEESRSLRSNQYQIQWKSKSIRIQNSVPMTSLWPVTWFDLKHLIIYHITLNFNL